MNHAFHTFIYNKFYSCLYHDLANTDVINFLPISSAAGYCSHCEMEGCVIYWKTLFRVVIWLRPSTRIYSHIIQELFLENCKQD